MAACYNGADYPSCPKSMSKSQEHDFMYKSHMPKGATQTPKGDLGDRRVAECNAQRGFKNHGGSLDASSAFGSHVGKPGSMGEKGNAK